VRVIVRRSQTCRSAKKFFHLVVEQSVVGGGGRRRRQSTRAREKFTETKLDPIPSIPVDSDRPTDARAPRR
jgi:hypothetical protein